MSDIPFVWMTHMAVNHGLHIYDATAIAISEDENGYMHNSRGKGWTKIYRKKLRFWDVKRTDRPVVHESVLLRSKNSDNSTTPAYKPWILSLDYDIEKWAKLGEQGWAKKAGSI